MIVENLPSREPPDFGDVRDPGRPILSFPWRTYGAHRVPAHRHARGHILHLEDGAFWVITPDERWLAASGQAIWIPPGVQHEVFSQGPVAAHVLFVDEAHSGPLPQGCGTVQVNALLVELFRRVVSYGNKYPNDGPEARLARVLLDELAGLEIARMMVPISREPRLARAMTCVIEHPDRRGGLDEVAREAGASARTLARLFVRETGLTFTRWKTRLILVESIERLAKGASVTDVATNLGYSPGSFTYMFRTNLGVPPRHYAVRNRG